MQYAAISRLFISSPKIFFVNSRHRRLCLHNFNLLTSLSIETVMAEIIKIKKGLDIPLIGAASQSVTIDKDTDLFGVVPDDFPGHAWRLDVKEGDDVKKGAPLLHSKSCEKIRLVSPVCGKIEHISRGERRKLLNISIRRSSDEQITDPTFPSAPAENAAREDIIEALCHSGLWALMRSRPYDIVANPDIKPRDIFISAFDSAPLAPALISPADKDMLEAGIRTLSKLTDGKVYLGVRFGSGLSSSVAETLEIQGPHPAGNTGVQIAAVKPVNKGETVWTLDARTVVRIGRFVSGKGLDTQTSVAITGEMCSDPHIIDTTVGASIPQLIQGLVINDGRNVRTISGNVLTGHLVTPEAEFLRYPYRQVTLIPEGDDKEEFMGWASLDPNRYSVKRSFPSFLRKKTPFSFDARLKGGRRAMILNGEYDRVFPMDIYPEYLLKAIISGNIDQMEKLGIYEVSPEDFALPEFVDTSKLPLQQIVRQGLDALRKEEEG